MHRITEIDKQTASGTCSICGPGARLKHRPGADRWTCWQADRDRDKKRRNRVRPRDVSWRPYHLSKKYGLSEADYAAMLAAQSAVCAICGRECSTGRRLAVDHCHETGRVRGLLCGPCNRGLGLLGDNPTALQSAIQYLNQSLEQSA